MSTPLLENILAQPRALEQVADYQFGPGLPVMVRCAELLRQSKSVVLTRMGASLFACTPMRYALARRGINASVSETAELLYFLDPLVERDTVVILVSRSGESVETVRLLEHLNQHGCPTIADGRAVRWIGPLDPASSLCGLGDWPANIPPRLASIFEAAPLQMLAYRTAELRGVVPGVFRWASTVTGSECGFPGLTPG